MSTAENTLPPSPGIHPDAEMTSRWMKSVNTSIPDLAVCSEILTGRRYLIDGLSSIKSAFRLKKRQIEVSSIKVNKKVSRPSGPLSSSPRGIFFLVAASRARAFISSVLILSCVLLNSVSSALALSKPTFPVIFIHGLASTADGAWGPLRDFLTAEGWTFGGSPVLNVNTVTGINGSADFYTMNFSDYNIPDFPSQNLTLEQQGREVDAVIQAVLAANPGKSSVVLVAHSMGGLAARNYLEGLAKRGTLPVPYGDNVAKLITVGTPHQGAEIAVICQEFLGGDLCLLVLGINPDSVAVDLLRPDSGTLSALNNLLQNPLPSDVLYTSIQGTGTPVIGFGDDGDGIVSAFSQDLGNIPSRNPLMHTLRSITILDRSGCDPGFANLLPNETHTCETTDQGVWAALLQEIPVFSIDWIDEPPPSVT